MNASGGGPRGEGRADRRTVVEAGGKRGRDNARIAGLRDLVKEVMVSIEVAIDGMGKEQERKKQLSLVARCVCGCSLVRSEECVWVNVR